MQKVKLAGYLGDRAPSPAVTRRPGTYVLPKCSVCHHKAAFLWIIFVLPTFTDPRLSVASRQPGAKRSMFYS